MGWFNWFGNNEKAKQEEQIKAFAEAHKVGFLKVPKDLNKAPVLKAAEGFIAPAYVDGRGFCTWTEDQGSTSQCAAYSTTSFAENILWRITHKPTQLDPAKVYNYAKQIDGDPTGDGTTLDCAILGLLNVYPNLFDKGTQPKLICAAFGSMNDIKFALHRYGCMIGGFNITTDWYRCNKDSNGWIPSNGGQFIGGHAVLVCGYNENGLQIQNSWGSSWGDCGMATLRWDDVAKQFMYGAVIKGCLKHIED